MGPNHQTWARTKWPPLLSHQLPACCLPACALIITTITLSIITIVTVIVTTITTTRVVFGGLGLSRLEVARSTSEPGAGEAGG